MTRRKEHWLLIAVSKDLPVLLVLYHTWDAAAKAGNAFLQEHKVPGKFRGKPPTDDDSMSIVSPTFTGSIGIYKMNV